MPAAAWLAGSAAGKGPARSSAQPVSVRHAAHPRGASRQTGRPRSAGQLQGASVLDLAVELADGVEVGPPEVRPGDPLTVGVVDVVLEFCGFGSPCTWNLTRLTDSPALSLRASRKAMLRRARAMPCRLRARSSEVSRSSGSSPLRRAASPMATARSIGSEQARSSTVRARLVTSIPPIVTTSPLQG